ncbi:uncharacterized protein (UPF0262 family)/protein-tyrosine-phosphatase [Devosia subaequoris]|uniref:Uncharacterized protein (UPF0262 family)/protein-tyrosine-phosphatase n=1 Tax=Devosia subaequoris TaxID=395930 RepID=A0A7W6ND89_9HYPH|nr:uncharacterized protein (UPF0262 family)/protein-tyrosine-phosphatase [Devosia subaequoris]
MGTEQRATSKDRLVTVTLDPNTITSINPDEVHEWRIAIYDLLEENSFKPARVSAEGPYALHMSIIGNYILLDVRHPETFQPIAAHYLSLTPFRRLIRDYFRIRDAYYEAIRSAQPFQIETVDMARRGMHNEAAELLRTRLTNKIIVDLNTARRLFTLICAVQPYASRIDEATSELPTVLFVCSMNSVRSPIAAALARQAFPGRLIARSVGVNGGKADQFVHEVMEEIGIDMSVHTPHILDELVANHFDLVITLSDDAPDAVQKKGLEAGDIEHWQVDDPSLVEGNRGVVLSAYRELRDGLRKRVKARLGPLIASGSQNL